MRACLSAQCCRYASCRPDTTPYAGPLDKYYSWLWRFTLKVRRVMRCKLTPFVFAGVLTSALLGLAGGVQAATLDGNSISAEFDYPDLGTLLCTSCFSPSTFTEAFRRDFVKTHDALAINQVLQSLIVLRELRHKSGRSSGIGHRLESVGTG